MNKTTMFVSSLMFLFSTAAFSSQEKEGLTDKIDIGVKLGFSVSQDGVISRNDDYSDNRFTIGANLRYWFLPNFGIGAEVHFEKYSISYLDESNDEMMQTKTKIPASFNGYYRLSDSDDLFTPYLGGGMTVLYLDNDFSGNGTSMIEMPLDDPETVLGFNIVAGFEYKSFFVETQYIWAEADSFKEITFTTERTNVGGLNFWFGFRF